MKWKNIHGFEGYQISNTGLVKSTQRVIKHKHSGTKTIPERIIKHYISTTGYRTVKLYKKNKGTHFKVHRLIADHFISNPNNKKTINHNDGNKLNNELSNLSWMTYKENNYHAFETGLIKIFGEQSRESILTEDEVIFIRTYGYLFNNVELGKMFGVNRKTISDVKNYKTWKFKFG